jgi:hypothetical protein
MSFNIGTQQANLINNVAGDQINEGGQQVAVGDVDAAREQVRELRAALRHLHLPADTAGTVAAELDGIEQDLDGDEVDDHRIADRLGHITQALSAVGALVAAGTGLAGPLAALAAFLGPLGKPIVRMLRA